PWNGIGETLKIAAMADAYEVNVAPHNFYSHLATMMSAHFAAVVPNLRIMEIDPDMVPWQDELVTVQPSISNGYLELPSGPGGGGSARPSAESVLAWGEVSGVTGAASASRYRQGSSSSHAPPRPDRQSSPSPFRATG
ncbi:MAG: hypothetical protein C4345_11195, partial [Chloroflexota bacterium]